MANLEKAFKLAEKKAKKQAKKSKAKREHYLEIKNNKEFYLKKLQESLIDKTYKTSEYKRFKKYDSGKMREITDLPFYPDRIAQRALMNLIEPIIIKTLIYHTFAALPKRGAHLALQKLRQFMKKDKEGTQYCLKTDVKKYFNNIDGNILKQMLRRKIKCKDTLWLLDEIIDSYPQGIPIGNYTSQYFGNYFLSQFDHWIKEVEHRKYYERYMDDKIILGGTKEELHQLLDRMKIYLSNIGLRLKDNYQIYPTRLVEKELEDVSSEEEKRNLEKRKVRGIDFVGYRTFDNYTLLRKTTKKNLKKATRAIRRRADNKQSATNRNLGAFASYNGILKHCSGFHLRQNSLSQVEKYIKKEIKKCKTTKKLSEVKQTDQKS